MILADGDLCQVAVLVLSIPLYDNPSYPVEQVVKLPFDSVLLGERYTLYKRRRMSKSN